MNDPLLPPPPPPPQFIPIWPSASTGSPDAADTPAIPPSFDLGGHRGIPLAPLRWPLALVFGIVVAIVGVGFGSSWLVVRSGVLRGLSVDARVVVLTAVIAVQYLLPILLVAWWARTRGVRFFEAFALRRFDVGVGVSVAMGCAVAGRMVGIQYSVLMQQLGIRAPENLDVTRLFPVSPIGIAATVLASVVIAPLAEEVLFRGVVFAGLRDRWGQLAGILVSSGLFALVHLSAYQFVPVFILGMLLAVLASSTRSIWPSILCHALFNASGVAMLYLLRAAGVLG